MKFVIQGETPSKKNSRILNTKTKRSFPSRRYIEWRDYAILQVRSQLQGWKAPVPCQIKATFFHSDLHRRDSDNAMSSILDMLKDNGTIIDDCWEYIPHEETWNKLDRGNARCEIEITEYKEN